MVAAAATRDIDAARRLQVLQPYRIVAVAAIDLHAGCAGRVATVVQPDLVVAGATDDFSDRAAAGVDHIVASAAIEQRPGATQPDAIFMQPVVASAAAQDVRAL